MDDKEILWNQYKLNVDLYRSYLELVVKINVFYYGITGAILSFYFAHPQEALLKYALLLPLVMSVALGVFFLIGAWLARVPRLETFKIRDALGLLAAPEIGVLIILLVIMAILMFIVARGLICVMFLK